MGLLFLEVGPPDHDPSSLSQSIGQIEAVDGSILDALHDTHRRYTPRVAIQVVCPEVHYLGVLKAFWAEELV